MFTFFKHYFGTVFLSREQWETPSRKGNSLAVFWILLGSILHSPVQSQEVARPFHSMEIAYPLAGVELGQAWDSAIGQPVDTHCLQFTTSEIEHASSRFEVHELRDSFALLEARNLTASASGSAFGVTAGAAYEKSTKLALDTDYLHYLASYFFHTTSSVVVSTTVGTEGKENREMRDVRIAEPIRVTFSNADEDSHALAEKFAERCGDYFVSAIHRGVRVNILATYASTNRSEQEAVQAEIRASGFGATVGGSSREDTSRSYDSSKFRLVIDQRGIHGGFSPTISKFDEVKNLIEKVGKEDETEYNTPYLISLKPYFVLSDWREIFGPDTYGELVRSADSANLYDIGLAYMAFKDLLTMLQDAETEFIYDQHRNYISLPESGMYKDRYNIGVMEMFGGIEPIRKNKGRVRQYLRVLDRVFRYCFLKRSCRGSIDASGLSDFLKMNKEELEKRLENADTRTVMDQRSPTGNRQGIGDMYLVTADDLEAETTLVAELEYSIEEFLKKGIREFHEILAAIPLPKRVVRMGRTVSTIKFRVKGERERTELLTTMIGDLIYFTRLNAWNNRFCDRGRAEYLCVQDEILGEIAHGVRIHIPEVFFGREHRPPIERVELPEYDPIFPKSDLGRRTP